MSKIKIVFILGTLEIGGTERQFLELVRRIDRERFALRVLAFHCQGTVRDEVEALNIPFTCLNFFGLKGKYRPISYWQLYCLLRDIAQYLRHEQPQIVQSYLFWANVYGSIAAKIAGVPVIITGRRTLLEAKYKRFPAQWLQHLSNLWATLIVSNSEAARQECLQHDRFVNAQKTVVIYNGIEAGPYAAACDAPAAKRALHLPEDALTVGMVANLHPYKGHRVFLHAAARVLQHCPHTRFLIVGRDRGIRAELERLADALGICEQVTFTGERTDIPKVLAVLDVQVSASFIESVSNALMEGMAAGKPIVATAIAGTPELVLHEQTGLLAPAGAPDALAGAIVRLLNNSALRQQMGQAGQQRIRQCFSMEQMIQQTEALYQKLAAAAKRP
jgi:glycosyltransferase involved in cell wall biosynthesis